MNTTHEFQRGGKLGTGTEARMVYVRPVAVADLPAEIQLEAEGIEVLYAVHDAAGAQLALVRDRRTAFYLARQHDMAPMSVH